MKPRFLDPNLRVVKSLKGTTQASLKPIFHQNAKYLASGAGVGQCPRCQNFALGIPTCWYLKCENLCQTPNAKPRICVSPDAKPRRQSVEYRCSGYPTQNFPLAMYISYFLCRFNLRLVANANPVSGGIWA